MGRTIHPDDIAHSSHRAMEEHRFDKVRSFRPRPPDDFTLVSKALSRLLRHQAENYGVPITKDGWVRLDHVLAWNGMNSSGKNSVSGKTNGKVVEIEDVFMVVEDNEKQRFALRLTKDVQHDGSKDKVKVEGQDVGVANEEIQDQPITTVDEVLGDGEGEDTTDADIQIPQQPPIRLASHAWREAHAKIDSETARVIAYYRNSETPPPASEFMIRATQGHSIKTIAADTGLLTPITLSDASTIPSTCVHGTFYGAWLTILNSGGLKRMGRNHVHFAEGPTLAELGLSERGEKTDGNAAERKEVISGMRRDAELLIYVDVKRALENEKDMEWWRSENGVILTAGALGQDQSANGALQNEHAETSTNAQTSGPSPVEEVTEATAETQVKDKKQQKQHGKGKFAQAAAQDDRMVSMKYWNVVVDAKGGRGVIWRRGEGVVQELPESLTSRGTPKGRGRGRGGGGRGGRGGGRGRGKQ